MSTKNQRRQRQAEFTVFKTRAIGMTHLGMLDASRRVEVLPGAAAPVVSYLTFAGITYRIDADPRRYDTEQVSALEEKVIDGWSDFYRRSGHDPISSGSLALRLRDTLMSIPWHRAEALSWLLAEMESSAMEMVVPAGAVPIDRFCGVVGYTIPHVDRGE